MTNVPITPVISMTTLTCGTISNLATVTSATLFGSVVAGQAVHGVGIPFGTVVLSVESPSGITLSKRATFTDAAASLQFGYFTSAIYAAGDCLGIPFEIPLNSIEQIVVVDAIKVITAAKLYVFSAPPAPTLDNAAFAPADADAKNVIGYYSLTGTVALSANQIIFPADAELPLAKCGAQRMIGQLVVVGTPTFTAVNNLTMNIIGT